MSRRELEQRLLRLEEENRKLKEENAYLKFELEELRSKRYKTGEKPPMDDLGWLRRRKKAAYSAILAGSGRSRIK